MPGSKPEIGRDPSAPAAPKQGQGAGPAPYPPAPSFLAPSHLAQDPDAVKLPLGREAQLKPGAQVDQYVIEAKIDEGGMGTVYRARQPLIGKCVAIKVIKPMFAVDPLAVDRFIREARAVNEIRHRNIIDIFAFGHLPIGLPYFVMEYLEGHTLQDELARRAAPFPLNDVMAYLRPVFSALEATHAAGIIHRDVKPENIFIAEQPGGEHLIKLLDFGLVKLVGNVTGISHRTSAGMPMGTPDYMAPEQCTGRSVDHRADIYSMGIIFYVLLTGRLPFEADSSIEVLEQHRSTEPPPMSVFAVIPRAVEEAVLWALRKDPNDRPQTLRALREAIEGAAAGATVPLSGLTPLAEPAEAEEALELSQDVFNPDAPLPSSVTQEAAAELIGKGRLRGWIFAGVLVAALAALALVSFWHRATPPPETQPAATQAPSPPAPGTLRLEVEPAGAAVTVDGVPVAAGTDLSLAPGPHMLRATLAGHQPLEERLVLSEGASLVHKVKLTPQVAEPAASEKAEPTRRSKRSPRRPHGMRDQDDTARPSFVGPR